LPTNDPLLRSNAIFHDPSLHRRELARIFRPTWRFLLPRHEAPGGARALPLACGPVRVSGSGDGLRAEAEGRPLPLAWLDRLAFVHLGEPERTLEEELGDLLPFAREVAALAGGRELLVQVDEAVAANWKLVVSGAIEDYHLGTVHGRTVAPWQTEAAVPTLGARGNSSYTTPARFGPLPRALHRLIAGPPPSERFTNALVYPNLLLIRLWGLTHVTAFVPQGPDRTLRRTRIYAPAPARLSPTRPARWTVAQLLERGVLRTAAEDRAVVEEAHAGTYASRDLQRGPAHTEEARVEHFLAETARRLTPGV
jgi:phenylpropionate dioxygenase-like ring-hydroxylating dioxygenase large terminal subunit